MRRREAAHPSKALLTGYPEIRLDSQQARRFCHGQAVLVAPVAAMPSDISPGVDKVSAEPARRLQCRVLAASGQLLGTAWLDEAGMLQPKRLLAGQELLLQPEP